MNEKLKNNNWIKSILINAIIMAIVMCVTRITYETNDDFVISTRIIDGYPEIPFINYYYCLLLTVIQRATSFLNIHVIAQIALSFCSFVFILKIILDECKEKAVLLTAIVLLAFFSMDHYARIQFTKTAALITVAGALLLVDALIKKRGKPYYILGIAMFIIGGGLRLEGIFVPFGFAGLYVIVWMFEHRKNLKDEIASRKIVFCVTMIAIIGGSALFQFASIKANTRTPDLKNYMKYNDLRSLVIDFSVLDYYEEQKEEYRKAGFTDADISLIKSWEFDYDGAASLENLETILEISKHHEKQGMTIKKALKQFLTKTKKTTLALDPQGAQIIVLILLGLWLIASGKGSARAYAALCGVATITLHVLLYYIERPAYRAFYVPNLCAAIFMMYAFSKLELQEKMKRITGIALAFLIMILIIPGYKESVETYNSNSRKIMDEEFIEFLNDNKDKFYVVSTREKKINPGYTTPWKAPDTSIDENCMGAGSWGTMSPCLMDKLAAYNMRNPIRDLLYVPNAYYIGNKRIEVLTEYYNGRYAEDNKQIHMNQETEIAGMKVWKPRYE